MARAVLGALGRDETEEAARAFGVQLPTEQRAAADVVEIWPDDEDPVALFRAMRTQWRTSLGGFVGLDYAVVPLVAEQLGLSKKRLRRAFGPLQVMEDEALAVFEAQKGSK